MKKYNYLKDQKNYIRPTKTYTDQLTEEQIAEKLEDYVKVDDIQYVKIRTHMRYYCPDKRNPGKLRFCMGGFLKFKKDEYIILSQGIFAGSPSWSVQKKGAIFYRKMTPQEKTNKRIAELEEENKQLREQINKLKKKKTKKWVTE